MKQVTLLVVTNFAVLMMLSGLLAVLRILGVIPPDLGLSSYTGMLVLSALMGFGGAFISLAMSKTMAKHATGAQVITQPRSEVERWLVETVRRQAQAAGIQMPEVAIYASDDMNAFATGMSKDSSLVAVTTGLLNRMTREGHGTGAGRHVEGEGADVLQLDGDFGRTGDARMNAAAHPVLFECVHRDPEHVVVAQEPGG